jgi:CotH kinase protein
MRTLLTVGALALCVVGPGCSAAEDADSGEENVTTATVGSKAQLFGQDLLFVRIQKWDPNKMANEALGDDTSVPGAELIIFKAKPTSSAHCPDAEESPSDVVYRTQAFDLRTSGNFTKGTPKSSFKIGLNDKKDRLFEMKALNLKAMWNDVSQMREGFSWSMFDAAGVRGPRHTYAKFCINQRYYGLYSLIEEVDEPFLKERFPANKDGNLYKAFIINEDIGPADLAHRSANGDDSGRQYFKLGDLDQRTYRLKTNDSKDSAPLQTYDDLATFIRVLNGLTIGGGDDTKFNTADYKQALEQVFDVKGFLRWAAVNSLLGAWDNYYLTPANYYIYNAGHAGDPTGFMQSPYFVWIPWDYDNTLGVDFFHRKWQFADILDWEGTVAPAHGNARGNLPLIRNVLKNDDFVRYYLDAIEFLNDTFLTEANVNRKVGGETGPGFRARFAASAFLEADGPSVPAHTGRQFTNDEVFANGISHNELTRGDFHVDGILHYVRMRHDNVAQQLGTLRARFPKGSSGARFPAAPDPIP